MKYENMYKLPGLYAVLDIVLNQIREIEEEMIISAKPRIREVERAVKEETPAPPEEIKQHYKLSEAGRSKIAIAAKNRWINMSTEERKRLQRKMQRGKMVKKEK